MSKKIEIEQAERQPKTCNPILRNKTDDIKKEILP